MLARFGFAAILVVSTVVCAQTNDRERTTDLVAVRDQEVRAGHFEIGGGRGCPNNAGVPAIVVMKAPVNGSVTVREGDALYGRPLTGGIDTFCDGKTLHGIHIYYRPRPGFSGNDVFAYKVTFPKGTLLTTTRVQVQ